MIQVRAVLLLLLAAGTADAYDSVDDPRTWAIAGILVVDIETGNVAANRTIVIRNGAIQSILDAGDPLPEPDLLVVRCDGCYAIPGLWDAHVHIRGGPERIAANERWLPQYLAFGVTTVRDAGGDLPNSVRHWRDEIARGLIRGPRIFSALRKIDGSPTLQPGGIEVVRPEEAERAVDALALSGADFIKIYDGTLLGPLALAAVEHAESIGMRTAAHVTPGIAFDALIEAGLDSVEHAFFLAKAANPRDRELAVEIAAHPPTGYVEYFGYFAGLADVADFSVARQAFRRMAAIDTAVVSTLMFERGTIAFLDGAEMEPARREQVPAPILETLDQSAAYDAADADRLRPIMEAVSAHTERLLGLASDEGVTILAGSDTGVNNSYLYPGVSLHAELEVLVEIGLTTHEALKSATLDPARWIGAYPHLGVLAPGSAADMVLLTANPLDDIRNTRSIAAVVQQGVYFDTAELEVLKRLDGAR